MNFDPTIIVVVVVGIFVIWIAGKAFLGMAKSAGKKITGKDMMQHKINKLAGGSDEERWHAVGGSARKAAKSGGCLGKLILLGIIIIVVLAILSEIR